MAGSTENANTGSALVARVVTDTSSATNVHKAGMPDQQRLVQRQGSELPPGHQQQTLVSIAQAFGQDVDNFGTQPDPAQITGAVSELV